MTPNNHFICEVETLKNHGDRIISEIDGIEVSVFNIYGELHAIANYCPHQSGPLCEGELTGVVESDKDHDWEWKYCSDGELIECPWHSWKFEVNSGKNVKSDKYSVPTYAIEVEDDNIYVKM